MYVGKEKGKERRKETRGKKKVKVGCVGKRKSGEGGEGERGE